MDNSTHILRAELRKDSLEYLFAALTEGLIRVHGGKVVRESFSEFLDSLKFFRSCCLQEFFKKDDQAGV